MLFCGAVAQADPLIGISFPPVADSGQRQFTIDALRPLGVTHIRFAENWRRRGMEPDFGPLVQRIAQMRAAGFDILLTVQSNGPDAACATRNTHSCLITADAPLERYLQGLLQAVGDDLDAIQFGNEWDSQFVGTAAEFLALHQRFAQVVRRDRPDLTIVLGGVTGRAAYAQALCIDGNPVAIPGKDVTALVHQFCITDAARNTKAMTDVAMVLGAADYDVADIHLYDVDDLWPAATEWFAGLTGGRPIWVTEFGGPTPDFEPHDPDYQAQRLRSYLEVASTLPVARLYYFKLTDDDGSIHDRSGLYDQRGRPKPALDVFRMFLARQAATMHHPLSSLIDQIVQNAEKRGAFDDLPGAGKPLSHLDDPQNAVLARMMKEADAKSPVVILRQQILAAHAALKMIADETERREAMVHLSELQTKLAIEMEAFRKYG